MAGAVAGTGQRSGAEDRAAAADLHGPRGAGVCANREANCGERVSTLGASLQVRLRLRGWLGSERGRVLTPLRLRSDDLHLLPVVGKFSSAIQASYVGSGQCAGLRTTPRPTNSHWEAVPGVPAPEKKVNQSCHPTEKHVNHWTTFHARAVFPGLFCVCGPPTLQRACNTPFPFHPLRTQML